jgi:hypothetical protein
LREFDLPLQIVDVKKCPLKDDENGKVVVS